MKEELKLIEIINNLFKNLEIMLQQAIEITSSEYMKLQNPKFISQTSIDDDMMYWMIFEDNNTMYKIHNKL